MRNLILTLALLSSKLLFAQSEIGIAGSDNWMTDWTNFKPKGKQYDRANQVLKGIISTDLTLSRRYTYSIEGTVYVTNNAKLTIESGTIIRGDFTTCGVLVITSGAKIIAVGEKTAPIVFTSSKPENEREAGDWGGIVVMGNAPVNRVGGLGILNFDTNASLYPYGGENINANAGIMKYVRIEYAGRKTDATKETNALTLAGVGRETIVENVQVSLSNNSAFKIYGGDLTLSNLVSYKATNDDFSFTQGSQCNLKNSLAIRYPYASDMSGSRCLKLETIDKVETLDGSKPETLVNGSNLTFTNNEENNEGLVKEAIYVGQSTNLNLKSTVISGFNQIALLDRKISPTDASLNKLHFTNVFVNGCKENIVSENKANNALVAKWFDTAKAQINFTTFANKEFFIDSNDKNNFDFRLMGLRQEQKKVLTSN
jgi:hypothetical protein